MNPLFALDVDRGQRQGKGRRKRQGSKTRSHFPIAEVEESDRSFLPKQHARRRFFDEGKVRAESESSLSLPLYSRRFFAESVIFARPQRGRASSLKEESMYIVRQHPRRISEKQRGEK